MSPKDLVNGKASVQLLRVGVVVVIAVSSAWLTTMKTLGSVQTQVAVARQQYEDICRRIDGLETATNTQTTAINAMVTAVRVLEAGHAAEGTQ